MRTDVARRHHVFDLECSDANALAVLVTRERSPLDSKLPPFGLGQMVMTRDAGLPFLCTAASLLRPQHWLCRRAAHHDSICARQVRYGMAGSLPPLLRLTAVLAAGMASARLAPTSYHGGRPARRAARLGAAQVALSRPLFYCEIDEYLYLDGT